MAVVPSLRETLPDYYGAQLDSKVPNLIFANPYIERRFSGVIARA